MKKIIICFAVLLSLTATAQETTTPKPAQQVFNKTFTAELGGGGVLFSANYDERFKKERLGWGYRIGVGYFKDDVREYTLQFGYSYVTRTALTIPIGINYLFGKNNSDKMFEVGAGVTIFSRRMSLEGDSYNSSYQDGNFIGHFSFLYRKQPIDGGYTWKIGFTPLIGTNGEVITSAVIGLGYSF